MGDDWVGVSTVAKKVHKFLALMPAECSLPHDRFPVYFERFLQQNQDTKPNEERGRCIREDDFKDPAAVVRFVEKVCDWGGRRGPSVKKRVLQDNETASIQDVLRSATRALQEPDPNIGAAIKAIVTLTGLHVSFGSKHLRFLCPRLCPVLDTIISERMLSNLEGDRLYSLTFKGYRDFAGYCQGIAAGLTSEGTPNPLKRKGDEWYAADVEASLYAFLNNW